jgi:diguanylate cyclase (GGDEF)-like protein/PAS domain S-box-containing protein
MPLPVTVPAAQRTAPAIAIPRWSVRTFLIGLVLICMLPGVIGALGTFVYEYYQARQQQQETMLRTARALVQAVDYDLRRVQAMAQGLATDPALVSGDLETFYRRARTTLATAQIGTNVVLRDAAGRQLLNTLLAYGSPAQAPPAPEQVRQVFETQRPTVSNVFIGPVTRKPIVSVDVPVTVDGKVVYALGVGILPRQFNELLKMQNIPGSWTASVLDGNGTVVGRTRAADRFVGHQAVPSLVAAIASSGEGAIDSANLEGSEVRTYFSRSPFTGWSIAIGVPHDELAAATLRALSLLVVGAAFLLGIALIAARAMGHRIADSMRGLIGPATALGRGQRGVVRQVHVKEAAEVALAIDRASELLQRRDAELRSREAELREAHRLARFASWHWDLASGEVKTSSSMTEIMGRPVPPFPEQRGTLLTIESWERVRRASEEALLTGRGFDLELEFNHGSGETRWINSRAEPLRDGHGNIVALRGAILDITERRRTELRLSESEERFRLLADNIAQLAWMADGSGWVFWYNKRWFDYTGTTLDEMAGWGWEKVQHPDHLERVVKKIRACFESGEHWEDTFPLRSASGEYRWFLSSAVPECDATGRVRRWFGTNTDITAQREVEQELMKFKLFSDHASDGHMLLDEDGHIRYVNRRLCARLGYREEELLGAHISAVNHLYPPEVFRQFFRAATRMTPRPFEASHRRKDGTTVPVETTVTVLQIGGHWQMFASSRDIADRKIAEQRVIDAAMHDRLTGLPNRALVFEYGSHMLASAQREHGGGALLFIDLDRFKPINDLYGHAVGDQVLRDAAQRLVHCTRQEDLVGRLGGDEFVIILPHLTDSRQRAETVAMHVIESICRPFQVEELELSISPSIGISFFPEHGAEISALLHTADLAMYRAKQSGRSTYQVYTEELERFAGEALILETRLRKALRSSELALHYQPVMEIRSGRLIGAEALVRLADGQSPMVGPDRFIPVIESAGLVGELGEWVADEACRQRRAWQKQGLRVTIAVNVSPLQFRQKAFADSLRRVVEQSGTDPNWLQIEVTESTVMENVQDAIATLTELKSAGIKVALDDFGTGYSNLSNLGSLPLDKLKLDQSFVRNVDHDPRSRAIANAVIALGRAFGLEIVGEGIESREVLQYLGAQGCDQAQGYWFSRPLPAAEFAAWCHSNRLH